MALAGPPLALADHAPGRAAGGMHGAGPRPGHRLVRERRDELKETGLASRFSGHQWKGNDILWWFYGGFMFFLWGVMRFNGGLMVVLWLVYGVSWGFYGV